MTEQSFREVIFEESSVRLQLLQSKSMINLQTEEQILKSRLETLKKENFSLEASIKAWEVTHEQKQNELAEAESNLDKIYNQIWSAREEFCERADNFDNQYGILSEGWKEKMNEILNPALGKAKDKHQEKVESETNTSDVQEEVLQKENPTSPQICGIVLERDEVGSESSTETSNQNKNLSPDEKINKTMEFPTIFNEPETGGLIEQPEKVEPQEGQINEEAVGCTAPEVHIMDQKKKKVRFSEENDEVTIFSGNPDTLKMKFFSIVDTETVKKANWFKKLGKKHS